jgi:hypothetical protein
MTTNGLGVQQKPIQMTTMPTIFLAQGASE